MTIEGAIKEIENLEVPFYAEPIKKTIIETIVMERERIRAEVVEECTERVDRLMVNTICNPKLKTTEQIDIYLQCIRDAKRVISGKNIIKGEEDDNN